jgi:hypothetical protein
MKLTKLPNVKIVNPFSVNPQIQVKVNRVLLWLKVTIVTLLILAFSVGAYYANVQYEIHQNIEQKVKFETNKAAEGTGIVVDATAQIIARDGKVPDSVAKKYAIWIYEAASKYNVDPLLILSVMRVESGFDYKVVSSGNAIGLLQIIHSWHKEKTSKVGLFDPKNNIEVGAQILREYSDRSSTEAEALLRYNGSLGAAPVYALKVLGVKKKYEAEIYSAVVKDI